MAGAHVFGDKRLGVFIVDPERGISRLDKFKNLGITDLFFPGEISSKDHLKKGRDKGYSSHIWVAVNGRTVAQYVGLVDDSITRTGAGACDLNMEFGDDSKMKAHIRETMKELRADRPQYRFRLDIAPRKWDFIPVELVVADPQLYVTIQNYGGNMEFFFSAPDQENGLRAVGVPDGKISTMYAAHCRTTAGAGDPRVPCLPTSWTIQRGCIYQDDLLTDAGYIS